MAFFICPSPIWSPSPISPFPLTTAQSGSSKRQKPSASLVRIARASSCAVSSAFSLVGLAAAVPLPPVADNFATGATSKPARISIAKRFTFEPPLALLVDVLFILDLGQQALHARLAGVGRDGQRRLQLLGRLRVVPCSDGDARQPGMRQPVVRIL